MRAFLILLVAVHLTACGAGALQTTINTVASTTLVETQEMRAQFHVARDLHCREQFPPAEHTFSVWRECMEPSYKIDRAVASLDLALRSAERALQASGESSFEEALPSVLEAARLLVDTLETAGVEVPSEVLAILELR